MPQAIPKLFVFQCSGNTYMECIEKGMVGSNDPWPLQVKAGDPLPRHYYEYDSLFGLWRAATDGGKKLVAWAVREQAETHLREGRTALVIENWLGIRR